MSEGLFWKSVRVNKYFSLKKNKKKNCSDKHLQLHTSHKKEKRKKTPSKRPLICGFSSFSLYFKHKSRSDASKSEDEVFKCTYRVCRPILAGNPVTGRRIYRLTPSISGDTELHCTRALLNLSAPHPVSTNHASPSGSLIPLSLSPARSPSLWPPPLLLLPLLQPTVQTIQPYVTDPNKVFGEGEKLLVVHVVEGFSASLYGITSTPARLRLRGCEWKKRDAPSRQQDCEVLHIPKSF